MERVTTINLESYFGDRIIITGSKTADGKISGRIIKQYTIKKHMFREVTIEYVAKFISHGLVRITYEDNSIMTNIDFTVTDILECLRVHFSI